MVETFGAGTAEFAEALKAGAVIAGPWPFRSVEEKVDRSRIPWILGQRQELLLMEALLSWGID